MNVRFQQGNKGAGLQHSRRFAALPTVGVALPSLLFRRIRRRGLAVFGRDLLMTFRIFPSLLAAGLFVVACSNAEPLLTDSVFEESVQLDTSTTSSVPDISSVTTVDAVAENEQPEDDGPIGAPWCTEYEEWVEFDSLLGEAALLNIQRQVAWKEVWISKTESLVFTLNSLDEGTLSEMLAGMIDLAGPADDGWIDDPENPDAPRLLNETRDDFTTNADLTCA